jgi:hypothetical protein
LNNSKKSSPESSAGKNILNDDIKTSNKLKEVIIKRSADFGDS